jgi:hypothetical protein
MLSQQYIHVEELHVGLYELQFPQDTTDLEVNTITKVCI